MADEMPNRTSDPPTCLEYADVALTRLMLSLTPAQRLQALEDSLRAARWMRGTRPEDVVPCHVVIDSRSEK